MATPSMTVHYELEEKMGDGSWLPVFQSKEEADYETPEHAQFKTIEEARAYDARRFNNAIDRGYVRIVKVTTGRVTFI